MRRAVPAALTAASIFACGPRAVGPVTEPHVAPATETPAPPAAPAPQREGMRGMGRTSGMRPLADPTDPVLVEGKQTFDLVCSSCHTLEPPARLAPPMRMVSMHLRQAFSDEEEAVAHVVSWVPAPDPARSVLPAHAIERHGLMTAQEISGESLEKVARYVWSLSEGMRGMSGPGKGRGMGMGTRGGGGG